MGNKYCREMASRRVKLLLALLLATILNVIKSQSTVDDPQLLGSTMVIRQTKMYVFGGLSMNSTVPQNIIWQFDLNARSWSSVTPASNDKPPGRMFHSSVMSYDGRYMIVYGGIACFSRIQMVSLEKGLKEYHMQQDSIEYSSAMEDVWMFDFVTRMWTEMSPQRYARRASCPTAEGVKKLSSSSDRTSTQSWFRTLGLSFLVAVLAARH